MARWLFLCLTAWLLSACALEQPAPVLKIGLLGPFEGERRELGYHLLPAIRAATPESLRGHHIEWVILDTHGDPALAAQRTRELLADPALLALVGPLLPEEVAAVAPVVEAAEVAWWPLAPVGEVGLRAWHGGYEMLLPEQGWGARAWPGVRRGTVDSYLDPRLPEELGDFAAIGGEAPWPQDWLAWRATQLAFEALSAAPVLSREAIRATAIPLDIPAPALYQSRAGTFPGIITEP